MEPAKKLNAIGNITKGFQQIFYENDKKYLKGGIKRWKHQRNK